MSARARTTLGVIAILLGVVIGATVPAAASISSPGCSAVNSAVVHLTPLQSSTPEFIGQFYAGDGIRVSGLIGPFTYTVQQDSGPPIVVSDASSVLITVQGLGLISIANDSNAANTVALQCLPSNEIVITGIAPTSGSAGAIVTISGGHLDQVTAVHFGAAAATSFTINNQFSITATAPAGSGIVDVTASDNFSTSATSLSDQFTYPGATAPTVTAIAPASGPAAGGTSVTITGTGFGAATTVNFGSTAAAFTVINTTTITATSPPGTGIVDVTVANAIGTSATGAADRFSFAAPPVAGPKTVAAAYNSNGSTSTAIDLGSVITGGPANGVTVTVAPGHGGTSVSGTTLTYTPTTGYYGSDSFSYTASGPGGTSSAALVSITVAAPVITVTPTSPAAGKIGVAYSQALTAGGGNAPYAFSTVASGALPPGLSISGAGVISGTPTATGVFNFTVSGSDSSSTPAAFTSATISIAINLPTLGLTPASGTPLTAVAETAYSRSFTANGGTAPYSFAALVINSGALPAGLSFSTSTGILSGTATAAGSVSFTVSVTDSSTGAGPFVISGTYTLVVAAPAVTVAPSVLAVPTVGVSYSQTLTANGGSPAYSYAPTAGSLPAGLTLSASGVISGTPTTAGNYSFSVTATDSHGFAGSQTYSGAVNAPATTTTALVSSLNPSRLQDSVTFTATVTSTGGVPAGAVTFHDGASILGSSALTAGVATLITTSLSVGTHTITASFGGGGGFASSTSAALTQIVAIPADSAKLRQLQLAVTTVVAQASGHAITSSIDAAISDGFNDGGAFVTPSGGGLRFNFSADPDQSGPSGERAASDRWNRTLGVTNSAGENTANHAATGGNPGRIDDAFAAISRPTTTTTNTTTTKAPSIMQEPKQWLLWADIGESGINRWSTALGGNQSALYGSQLNALVGLTRRVTPSFLAGIIGGYETFDYTSQDVGGKLKGQGWTLGSYVGWKLAPSIRFDAAVAYSGIGYDGIAGTAQGNFAGRRWLASGGLTGTYKALGFDIEPSVKVYALWERENAYTDSLGTLQDHRDFSTGRSSGGVRLSYPIAWSETIALMPYVGVYGDYYFTRDDAASIVVAGLGPLASIPLLEGWSARATGGLAAKLAGGTSVAVGGELGGIGSNVQIWTYRVRARVPF